MKAVEILDMRIRAALPLHPYLAKHPRLFLRLLVDESVCGDTARVNGDLAAGVWDFRGMLYADLTKQSLTIAVLTGVKGPGIPVVSVTLRVTELLARVKACPSRRQEFEIFDSSTPIQLKLSMECSVTLSTILGGVSKAIGDIDATINGHGRDTQPSFEPDKSTTMSRRDIELSYAKVICLPNSDETKACGLSRLGLTYHALHLERSDNEDLNRAVSMYEEALQCSGLLHPQLADHAHQLSLGLIMRFENTGNISDVERAISHLHTALNFTENVDAKMLDRLDNLGSALQLRFDRVGDLADIESAIVSKQKATKLSLDDNPDRAGRLSSLGVAFKSRFDRLGNPTDLEDAISNFRQAVERTPNGHPSKPRRLSTLGAALQSRFNHIGNLADLGDSILNKQKAVELIPNDHPEKPALLNNLGNSLVSRFGRFGRLTDLEDAISSLQKAVQLTPDGHSNKASRFNNLGGMLQTNFKHVGGLTDLEDSIASLQQAIQLVPDSHVDKPTMLSNLSNALGYRFRRLEDLADMEDAISNQQKAIELTPDGHPDRPALISNLGNALESRSKRLMNLEDLEGAIENFRKAVQLTPDGHPKKAAVLNNIGTALQHRFSRLNSSSDSEDAISNLQKVIELTPDGHPDKPRWLYNLGYALIPRFYHLNILSDLERALSAFSTAAISPTGSAMDRFDAARAWAKLSEVASRSPLGAFSCAIDLLPRVAWVGLAVTDQHALLADVGGIVRDAVAAAIKHEKYETAVVWAEQGRSIVWQNLLGLRSPIDDLRENYPDLADRLQNVAQQLDGTGSHDVALLKMPIASAVHPNYSKRAIEWDKLVDEIRSIPQFEGFLRAKSFTQLAPAAHGGPVVILNVNDTRCDALVLVADGFAERHVSVVNIPLERFSDEKSKTIFRKLTELLSSAGVRERNDRKTGRAQSPAESNAKFKMILGILWRDVVKPVIEGLALQTQSGRPPRIWWCATGLLAFLPIHAAGLYDTEEIGEKVSDYVLSSYTPTLTAILELSSPVMREDFQVLMVAQPSAPGASLIPKTEDEVRIIHRLTDGARRVSLMGKSATVERVQEEMKQSNWIHLACHGQQNPDDPMESGFLLYDKVLKLSEIVKMTLPKADFAFLSACQTAMGNEKIAEESVHLAAGMLLSGCRGVIATTWSIRDEDAPSVAEDVYCRIFKDGKPNRKEAAYALHEAVKRLRESGAPCTSWVPFIHIGR